MLRSWGVFVFVYLWVGVVCLAVLCLSKLKSI